MSTRTCRYCTSPAHRHPASVTCGSDGCKKLHHRDRCRDQQRRLRAAAADRGESYAAQWRPRKSNTVCVTCGAKVSHGRGDTTKCRACHHPRVGRWARASARLERARSGTSGPSRFVAGGCWRCGTAFVGRGGNHCSVRCRRSDAAGVRRAREAGAKITPGRRFAVYERDSWTCQICGDPANRAAQVPDLDAPVVDHRIPLAQGGEHGPSNWQTAHFYCNSVKRDQMDFDFAGVAA